MAGASWGTVAGHSVRTWEKARPLLSPGKEEKEVEESDSKGLEPRPLGKGTRVKYLRTPMYLSVISPLPSSWRRTRHGGTRAWGHQGEQGGSRPALSESAQPPQGPGQKRERTRATLGGLCCGRCILWLPQEFKGDKWQGHRVGSGDRHQGRPIPLSSSKLLVGTEPTSWTQG